VDVRKIRLIGAVCVVGFVGCISNVVASPWEALELQFSRFVLDHEAKLHEAEFSDAITCIREELRYVQEIEARNPWDNFPLRFSEEYPALVEVWIRPLILVFYKEGFMGTKKEWRIKHRETLSLHFGHLRNLFQEDIPELDALVTLANTVDELEEASEEAFAPQGSVAESPIVLEDLPEEVLADPYVDQASILEEQMRRQNEAVDRFLRERFSFTDEQIEQYRTTFDQIYGELVGDL
jgi:hypothetical protein